MDLSRDPSRTANASSKLIETVEKFTELEESGFDDEHSAYHAVVSLVHQLCMNIGHAEKLGHNRTDIDRILEPVWELHSRSPFFHRMQSWPRGYPGDSGIRVTIRLSSTYANACPKRGRERLSISLISTE